MEQQELFLKQIVEEVLKNITDGNLTTNNLTADGKSGGSQTAESGSASCGCTQTVTAQQYPLGEKMAEQITSPTGKILGEMSLDQLITGNLKAEDMRISPVTLELQAQVAESVSRDAFAGNLRRAAELIAVPDDRLLEIYNSLRPYRCTKKELYDIADELETKYSCTVNAGLVREAADVYEKRGRLKQQD